MVTQYLDRTRPPTKVTTIKPHMEHIGVYIFKNWKPIKSNRFISEKCYFSNMIKMYVNRFMKCSVNDINTIIQQCKIIDIMQVPQYITSIIAEFIVDDFECNLNENMVMKISSDKNEETIYSLPNMFDNGNRRYYRTANKEWLILLIKLSTKYHVYNKDDPFYKHSRNGFISINDIYGDTDNIYEDIDDIKYENNDNQEKEKQSGKRDNKGFIITNIQIVTPVNDKNGVDKCTIWIFEDEKIATTKYNELNQYHENASISSDDDLETDYPEIEESQSFSIKPMTSIHGESLSKTRRFKRCRDESKFVAKYEGIRNMENGKLSQNMSYEGKYILFKLRSNNNENSCVDIANISIRIARL